jgi:WD40 repeat protein
MYSIYGLASLFLLIQRIFQIWEIKRKRVRTILEGYLGSIDFSPDGRFLVSGSYHGTIRIWRVSDGSSRHLSRPNGGFLRVNSVMFSPGGQHVVAGYRDGQLTIWDARTGRLRKEWQGHSGSVLSVAFQPDGKRLASASGGIWKSWNVSSLQGQLQSSEHMVNDEVEEEVLECEGHEVRFLLVPSCYTFSWLLFPPSLRTKSRPSPSHPTVDGSSPRLRIVLHASGMRQPACGCVR